MNGKRPMSGPGHYRIKVKGKLNAEWSDWFKGMAVSYEGGVTVLTGPVADQSALHGIFARIRDLGLPLISVTRIEPDQDVESAQSEKDVKGAG